jgi:hypothetical protein
MGKVFKKITKPIQKLIPKEIKPFLPALAAVFGPAAFASMGGGIGAAFAKLPAFAQAAIVNATTQGVVEGKIDPKQVAASGIMAQAGSSLKGFGNAGSNIPLESAAPKTFLQKAATATGEYLQPSSVSSLFDPNTTLSAKDVGSALYSGAKASLPVSTYAGAEKLKEINEDELRKYNEQLRERGVVDKIGRRKGIYDIYASIQDEDDSGKYRVYSDDYINSILDKYGYKKGGGVEKPKPIELPQDPFSELIEEFIKDQKRQEEIRKQYKANGGRIGFEEGGEVAALAAEVKRLQSENAELKSKSGLKETREGIDYATKGFEQAFGSPLMGQVPSPQRIIPGFARGGIADLETVAMQPNENENTQMASSDAYVKLVEYFESLGYDYDAASELAYEAFKSGGNTGGMPGGFAEGGKVMVASHSGNDDLAEQLFEEFLEMGMTPNQAAAAVRDYLNSSKMGMAEGGKVMVASHSGNDTLSEQLFEEFLGMGMTPDQAAAAVRDYFNSSRMGMEDGGKVVPMLPEGVFYKGKAKDYPGASKAIKDALKKNREKKAEGGLLGLKKGGVPAEFDYRGGGIIEVGSKPKADDVPARLSKGEFVLTKKAVDGIGNGSNREGAKVLYQLMDKLEAMA